MTQPQSINVVKPRRSPCGERGLKSHGYALANGWSLSLPVRGAWIEIQKSPLLREKSGRSPCGERGLKWCYPHRPLKINCRRSPCGERGLKSQEVFQALRGDVSLPVRGAWIEIRS